MRATPPISFSRNRQGIENPRRSLAPPASHLCVRLTFVLVDSRRRLGRRATARTAREIGLLDPRRSEDRRVAEYCVARGVPVIFVGESRGEPRCTSTWPFDRGPNDATCVFRSRAAGGVTGSKELWDGDYTISPLAGRPLADGGAFHDLPSWAGCYDRTWLISARGAAGDGEAESKASAAGEVET